MGNECERLCNRNKLSFAMHSAIKTKQTSNYKYISFFVPFNCLWLFLQFNLHQSHTISMKLFSLTKNQYKLKITLSTTGLDFHIKISFPAEWNKSKCKVFSFFSSLREHVQFKWIFRFSIRFQLYTEIVFHSLYLSDDYALWLDSIAMEKLKIKLYKHNTFLRLTLVKSSTPWNLCHEITYISWQIVYIIGWFRIFCVTSV